MNLAHQRPIILKGSPLLNLLVVVAGHDALSGCLLSLMHNVRRVGLHHPHLAWLARVPRLLTYRGHWHHHHHGVHLGPHHAGVVSRSVINVVVQFLFPGME